MREVVTSAELRSTLDEARAGGRSVGLVPTMGYLHAGHAALIEAAARDCDLVVTTVFVNPLQFAPGEDLASYPRDLDRDRRLAAASGADLLFAPAHDEMYPRPVLTSVSVAELSARLEGASRPTHFSGVATVVAKLFNLAGPCRAYFGEKDYQQLTVIRRMVEDLSFPVGVVGCPTVREPDGLAMSSRNAYLGADERQAATVLSQALGAGAAAIDAGERDAAAVRAAMRDVVAAEPLAQLDYADVADPEDLTALTRLEPHAGATVRLLIAARVGKPRLIDNIAVLVPVAT